MCCASPARTTSESPRERCRSADVSRPAREVRSVAPPIRVTPPGTGAAWLGREDSNLRMAESKSAALPLGYAPSFASSTGFARGGRTIMRGPTHRNRCREALWLIGRGAMPNEARQRPSSLADGRCPAKLRPTARLCPRCCRCRMRRSRWREVAVESSPRRWPWARYRRRVPGWVAEPAKNIFDFTLLIDQRKASRTASKAWNARSVPNVTGLVCRRPRRRSARPANTPSP